MILSQKFAQSGIFAGLLLTTVLVAADVRPVPSPQSGDDGWRWTANGWEHIKTWDQPPRPYPSPAALRTVLLAKEYQGPRYDFHPAALALLQLGVATMAFVVRPPRVLREE